MRSVTRWKLQKVSEALPSAVQEGCYIHTKESRLGSEYALHTRWARPVTVLANADRFVKSLLKGANSACKNIVGWDHSCRPYLISAISNGQWPQVRKARLCVEGTTTLCQLCEHAEGTLLHRHCCPATRPPDGWPVEPPGSRIFSSQLTPNRLHALRTRGVCMLRLPVDHTHQS